MPVLTPQPDDKPNLNWYGLKKLGFGEDYFQLTGDPVRDQIQIETIAFRISHAEHEGGLGRFGHFKQFVDLTWNNPASGSMKRFVWNAWGSKILRRMCDQQELSVAGCTSSGKCFANGTTILMHDRTVKSVEKIVPGDIVMGDDGTPRTVQEVHTGTGRLLKVTPHDRERDPWFCTPNHMMVFRSVLGGKDQVMELEAGAFANNLNSVFSELRLFRPSNEVLRKILPNHDEFLYHVQSIEEFGFSVEEAGEGDWVGFSVDGNHRFLLPDFTVVHNSDVGALYGVGSYVLDPTHTLVLVMSTSIKEAKKRIWKTVREYWEALPHLPGKALWATNEIRGLNYSGTGYGESTGIYLMAAEQGSEKDSVNKLIGMKAPRTGQPDESFEGLLDHPEFVDFKKQSEVINRMIGLRAPASGDSSMWYGEYEKLIQKPEYANLRNYFTEPVLRDLLPRLNNISQDRIGKVILLVDEATGVADAVLTAVRTNLQPGNVGHCQVIMMGNPALPYDTFGNFSKPKGGWDKVDLIKDEEWETETGGLCIRFNAEKNPRIAEKNESFSWFLRQSDIDQFERTYGRDSLVYHRMVLGTWCLTDGTLGIYKPADIELSGAREAKVTWGFTAPVPVSFLDPAFTAGGDRALATFGLVGDDIDGRRTLLVTHSETVKVDVNDIRTPPSYQIVRGWRKLCVDHGVSPQNASYDRTGGGVTFGDIVNAQWSPLVKGINFSGQATTNPLPGEKHPGTNKPIRACDRFSNRVTEIWYGAHPLFRSGQIRGVSQTLAKELCSRQHDKNSAGDAKVLKVESKQVFKNREGYSPDEADSFLGLVDFCKQHHALKSEEMKTVAMNAATVHGKTAWQAFREKARRITARKNLKSHE